MMLNTKICRTCAKEQHIDNFSKRSVKKDALRSSCKTCASKSFKSYYDENRSRLKEGKIGYYAKNSDRIREYSREYAATKEGKESQRRCNRKLPNARKSRQYYNNHKHKLIAPDHCQKCGEAKALEAHHIDYDLPMDVIYFCKPCHANWHIKFTPLNRVTGIFTGEKE